jgi:hypothetical protein
MATVTIQAYKPLGGWICDICHVVLTKRAQCFVLVDNPRSWYSVLYCRRCVHKAAAGAHPHD